MMRVSSGAVVHFRQIRGPAGIAGSIKLIETDNFQIGDAYEILQDH
jgi:hypothetical protein